MTIRIIDLNNTHAGVISILHQQCFFDYWSDKSISEIINMPGTSGFLVGFNMELPQGFILFSIAFDEVEILSIGVVPSVRKKGLGTKLIQATIEMGKKSGGKKLFLEVASNNSAARIFYEKIGFAICK